MADESNTKTMVIVAIIGAFGAIGAALIPIIMADRNPPAIVIAPPPAVTPDPAPAPARESAPPGRGEEPKSRAVDQPNPATKKSWAPEPAPATKKGAATKKAVASPLDEDRIQGRWRMVTQEARGKGAITQEHDDNPVWRFHGDQLEVLRPVDGKMATWLEGTYRIHRGPRGRGMFDASLTAGQGRKLEWVGIYDFEGDLLKVCYKVRRLPDDPAPERPTAFAVDGDSANFSFNARFRHFGPPR
jgi:uncharacterized protein (TIGR03067 family)